MKPDQVVRSTCPYCGVGCQVLLNVKDDHIFRVDAPFDAAPNYGRLCVKGRFGAGLRAPSQPADRAAHPPDAPGARPAHRRPRARTTGARPPGTRRWIWWPTVCSTCAGATARTASRPTPAPRPPTRTTTCCRSSCAACIGTNNVDHCARLCHAGSVTGLQLAIGSSAMSNSIAEMADLECFMVIGSNTTETHPVIATFLKQAVRPERGQADRGRSPPDRDDALRRPVAAPASPAPTRPSSTPWPTSSSRRSCTTRPSSPRRTEGFSEYVESLADKTPEWAEAITGVPADDIRRAARLYAEAERGRHLLGHGDQPEHPRHRQHPDADQPGPAVRPHGPAGHRAQPAARPEQRPGLLRFRRPAQRLHRLPAGHRRRRCAANSRRPGTPRCPASPA